MDSLAIAANGLVADGLGRGDPATARAAALRCLLYGGGVSAVLLGSLAAFPQGVSAIFTDTRCVIFMTDGQASLSLFPTELEPFNGQRWITLMVDQQHPKWHPAV